MFFAIRLLMLLVLLAVGTSLLTGLLDRRRGSPAWLPRLFIALVVVFALLLLLAPK